MLATAQFFWFTLATIDTFYINHFTDFFAESKLHAHRPIVFKELKASILGIAALVCICSKED